MRDREFVRGARLLLSDYVHVLSGQSALFVVDPGVAEVCSALQQVASSSGINNDFVSSELDWDSIADHLAQSWDAAVFFEYDVSHHTRRLLDHLSSRLPSPRVYRFFGTTGEAIRYGFRRRQATLRRRNWDLIAQARGAGCLSVESAGGTRLRIGLDKGAGWANTYGECDGAFPGVLPPAEVNTRSGDVNGIMVADGAIGSNLGWPLDARLRANPVTLRILHGKVIDVHCRQRLVRDLIEEFLCVPGCNNVVEIGIGTNDGIPQFVASDILINERYAGFHLGLGRADAAEAERNLHIDFILDDCCIAMGARTVFNRGVFARPTFGVPDDPRNYDVPVSLHDAL